ncbi:MAG: rRNA maturation RNase YbeY [Nitrospinota bacterium]
MPTTVANKQRTAKIDRRWIASQVRKLLKLLGCPGEDLSVLLVDDDLMAELNGRYRAERRPTDVLAFPMRGGAFPEHAKGLLGDVVISVETARRQARPRRPARPNAPETIPPGEVRDGDPLGDEVLRLLIHGTLHLLGHDHETRQAARTMRSKERRCLQALGTPGKADLDEERAM